MKSLVQKLIKLLTERKLTVSFAESVTCGLASHQLNITEGTSEIFMGSIICYNEKVKMNLLKVNSSLIKKYTAESQEVTDALAKNLPQLIDADIYVAITGLDADGGSETPEKPVGTVFFSLLHGGKLTRNRKKFDGSPLDIKKQACEEVYHMIINELEK
ncbi:MAG TPA: CinA family protein [Hanamia sp.]|nr:CinA family protein [Hanamia sp.]